MKKTLFSVVWVVTAGALATGCFFRWDVEGESGGGSWSEPRATASSASYVVEEAWLEGEMRTVGNFSGDAYQIDYSRNAITIHTGARNGDHSGWAMIRLTSAVPEGFESEYFDPEAEIEAEIPPVGALGCSGPSHGNWDFDGNARSVDVTVERGDRPGSRLIHFTAVYDGGQVTRGSALLVAR